MDTALLERVRIADDIEAAAYRNMYTSAPTELIKALSLNATMHAGLTLLMAKGIPDPVFARVIGLGNNGHVDDATIDAFSHAYDAADIHSYWVHVNPLLAPRTVAQQLESRGFSVPKRRTWAKMVRGAQAIVPVETPLVVRCAQPKEYIATSTAIATAFGMPPPFATWIQVLLATPAWTMVTALHADRIVGGGLLFIEGTHAWLGLGGVIPEARRRNAHRAIMAARIAHAIERGCKHIVTETGEPMNNEPNPSLRNMYRLGFEKVASRLNFASPGS